MASFTPQPLPRSAPRRGPVSARKVILGLILAGSIVFFFLILFAGTVAILLEAAPRHGSHTSLLAAIKQIVIHAIRHFF